MWENTKKTSNLATWQSRVKINPSSRYEEPTRFPGRFTDRDAPIKEACGPSLQPRLQPRPRRRPEPNQTQERNDSCAPISPDSPRKGGEHAQHRAPECDGSCASDTMMSLGSWTTMSKLQIKNAMGLVHPPPLEPRRAKAKMNSIRNFSRASRRLVARALLNARLI